MWGPKLIIDSLPPPVDPGELHGKQEDRLVLSWEQRRWMRGRFTTERGRKIGIALPTGTSLVHGTILHLAADWYLKIEAAIEPVLEAVPADYEEGVRIAFEVGNLHFPLALRGKSILVPDDKAMIRVLDRLGIAWERRQTIFDPVGNTQVHQHEIIS